MKVLEKRKRVMTKNNASDKKALSFLNVENLRTKFDNGPIENSTFEEYAQDQYEKGKQLGEKYGKVNITINDTWSCGNISSHEKIGHARNTAELMQGFLDSGASIVVHRDTQQGITSTEIKKNTQNLNDDLQLQALTEAREIYANARIVPMIDISNNSTINAQIEAITNGKFGYGNFKEHYSEKMISSEDNSFVMVYPSSYIRKRMDRRYILNNVDGVEQHAAIIEKKNIGEIDYMHRESGIDVDIDGRNFTAFIQPKQHYQDQQKVFYISEENMKKPNMNYSPK
tara:strand:+ start:645 stop:1499 length:855 start_codon:yes stop_codon:yes gene_type:complete